MQEHGRSLNIDDPAFLPAANFQNHRVPAEEACYICHTDYTMYGDINAKLPGLRHVYVYYLGNLPRPADIKLYRSYNNRECLHCHEGARTFEEGQIHNADPAIMAAIKSNEMSCISSGCHDQVYAIGKITSGNSGLRERNDRHGSRQDGAKIAIVRGMPAYRARHPVGKSLEKPSTRLPRVRTGWFPTRSCRRCSLLVADCHPQ
jgi:hypothetical protein